MHEPRPYLCNDLETSYLCRLNASACMSAVCLQGQVCLQVQYACEHGDARISNLAPQQSASLNRPMAWAPVQTHVDLCTAPLHLCPLLERSFALTPVAGHDRPGGGHQAAPPGSGCTPCSSSRHHSTGECHHSHRSAFASLHSCKCGSCRQQLHTTGTRLWYRW